MRFEENFWLICGLAYMRFEKKIGWVIARRAYCVGETSKSMCVRPSDVRPCVRTWCGRRKWSYQVQIVNLGFQKYHFEPVFDQVFENLMDLVVRE